MIGRNFHEHDAQAVRVLDPHLGQPPRFHGGRAENTDSGRRQPVMLRVQIPHLEPDRDRTANRLVRTAGDLEQPRAEEEHHPGILGRPELPVDRQAQHVTVKPTASPQVARPHQDPAAQYLHTLILTGSARLNHHRALLLPQ